MQAGGLLLPAGLCQELAQAANHRQLLVAPGEQDQQRLPGQAVHQVGQEI